MFELSLEIGGEETNALDTAMFMFSLSSVLQWSFSLVVVATVAKYIKKENANSYQKKHSQKNHRKGR